MYGWRTPNDKHRLVQVSVSETRMAHQTIGVVATGAYTKVSLADCTVVRSSRVGMHVFGAATVAAQRVTVSGSTEHGALVQHAHSELDLTECTLSGSGASGVQAAVGAALAMRRCRLTSNKVAGAQVMVRPVLLPSYATLILRPVDTCFLVPAAGRHGRHMC